jgi:hypothetical protein
MHVSPTRRTKDSPPTISRVLQRAPLVFQFCNRDRQQDGAYNQTAGVNLTRGFFGDKPVFTLRQPHKQKRRQNHRVEPMDAHPLKQMMNFCGD